MKHTKRTFAAVLAAIMVFTGLAVMPMTVSAENITATPDWKAADDGIFYVTCPADLVAFGANAEANNWYTGKTVKLTCDLDMAGHTWKQATSFRGVLDGQGHAIKNLTITSSGMFSNSGKSTVKDLAIVGGTVNAKHPAVFARDSLGGQTLTFENVYIAMDITVKSGSEYAGGFLGQSKSGAATKVNFKNCVNACKFYGAVDSTVISASCGGFVGWSSVGATISFTDCIFIGDLSSVSATYNINDFIGGLRCNLNMTRCISAGKKNEGANYHSILGFNNPTAEQAVSIRDCYVASQDAPAFYALETDVFHSVSIQYGEEAAYTLASGTALSEKTAEMNGKIKRLDSTLTAKNFATLYPDLAGSGNWVATEATVTCGDNVTVAKILPTGVAALVEKSVTATEYLQTKAGENGGYDLRFISVVNVEDLAKYASVGFEVSVSVRGGSVLYQDTVTTQTVFTSVIADGVDVSAASLSADYLNVLQINGFKGENIYDISILSFAELEDGTRIYDYNGALKVAMQNGSTVD